MCKGHTNPQAVILYMKSYSRFSFSFSNIRERSQYEVSREVAMVRLLIKLR